jgi:hypothetical protein
MTIAAMVPMTAALAANDTARNSTASVQLRTYAVLRKPPVKNPFDRCSSAASTAIISAAPLRVT